MYQKGDSGAGECSPVGGMLAYGAVIPALDPQHMYKPGVVVHSYDPIVTAFWRRWKEGQEFEVTLAT